MFEGPFGDRLGLSCGPRSEGGGGRRCGAEGVWDTVDDERAAPPPRDARGGACERQRLEDLGARREGRGHFDRVSRGAVSPDLGPGPDLHPVEAGSIVANERRLDPGQRLTPLALPRDPGARRLEIDAQRRQTTSY